MSTLIEQSIIATLAYFDLFDIPLTREELYRWLWKPPANYVYEDFLDVVEHSTHWQTKDGFVFLTNRGEITQVRDRAVLIVEHKMKRAKHAVKILRFVPFVRAVFVCNTIASGSPEIDSDIDLFIVIKRGRLWLTRFFVTSVLSFVGMRRTRTHVRDRICLSFYITDAHERLYDVCIPGDDIYMAYWLDQLIPVFDPEDVLTDIQQANPWVKQLVPNVFQPYTALSRWRVNPSRLSRLIQRIGHAWWGTWYGNFLEGQAKGFQQQKMKRNTKSKQGQTDTDVVISDTMLKFHENDRRKHFREQWKERIARYE